MEKLRATPELSDFGNGDPDDFYARMFPGEEADKQLLAMGANNSEWGASEYLRALCTSLFS